MTWPPKPSHIPMLDVPFGQNISAGPKPDLAAGNLPDTEPKPAPPPPDAAALLSLVASALTACEAAGVTVRLKHGAVMTPLGYVLPLGDGRWGARTLAWTEFSAQAGSDDED